MKKENQPFKPADRLATVSEYYFSRKLKEVAQMNAQGMDIISLGIGSPDMPPSAETIQTLCTEAQNPDGHGYMPYIGIPELRQAFAKGNFRSGTENGNRAESSCRDRRSVVY